MGKRIKLSRKLLDSGQGETAVTNVQCDSGGSEVKVVDRTDTASSLTTASGDPGNIGYYMRPFEITQHAEKESNEHHGIDRRR